jgi:hypothetical protein
MRRALQAVLAALATAGPAATAQAEELTFDLTPEAAATAEVVPWRMQAPLLRPLHLPAPASPRALAPGGVELTHTVAVTVARQSDAGDPGSNSAVSITEGAWQSVWRWRFGVVEGIEAGFELAWVRHSKSPKSDERAMVRAQYRGETWLDVREADAALYDPALWVKWAVAEDSLAVRLSATIPAGERDAGTGLGTVQTAVTLLAGAPLGHGFRADAMLSVTNAGRPRTANGGRVSVDPIWQGMLALGWDGPWGLSANLHVLAANNPFPTTGNDRLDLDVGEVLLALRWRPAPGAAIGVVFTEDLSRIAPDFSAGVFLQVAVP